MHDAMIRGGMDFILHVDFFQEFIQLAFKGRSHPTAEGHEDAQNWGPRGAMPLESHLFGSKNAAAP